jgi:hypothetical protein
VRKLFDSFSRIIDAMARPVGRSGNARNVLSDIVVLRKGQIAGVRQR